MTHQMNGQQLQKALEMLAEVVSPLKKEETVLERPSDGDLLYYDNVSMMEKLKVSERTLQRYRKNGKIRHTTFGGKIYYPKNFMVLPVPEPEDPEGEKNNIVPLNEFTKRYNTPRPRSKRAALSKMPCCLMMSCPRRSRPTTTLPSSTRCDKRWTNGVHSRTRPTGALRPKPRVCCNTGGTIRSAASARSSVK